MGWAPDARRALNGDWIFDFDFVVTCLGYTDIKEAIKNHCPNTPRNYLQKGHVNEYDLCQLLAHAPDVEAAKILKGMLVKETLGRPLNPTPLHTHRDELERQVREERRHRREARRRAIEASGRDPYPWELPLSGDEEAEQPEVWAMFYPDDGGEPEMVKLSLYSGY